MTNDLLLRLQTHINSLTAIKRNHNFPGSSEKEDDTSHSFSVALFAWQLNEACNTSLNPEKLLKYALIHDFVEVYAGDVNTFASADLRAQKEIDEQIALKQLCSEYADAPDLVATLTAYQNHADEEAVFVWGCDKMQALIQGKLDNWRCYYTLGITDARFKEKIDEQRARIHPALFTAYDELVRDCIASYHYATTTETEMQPEAA